jgi:hypothetical protein
MFCTVSLIRALINNTFKSCITLPNKVENNKCVVALWVFLIQFWFLEVLSYF